MRLDRKKQTRKYKRKQLAHLKYGYAIILLCAIFLPSYTPFVEEGINTYEVILNGSSVGRVEDTQVAEECLVEARRAVAKESEELILVDAHLEYVGSEEVTSSLSRTDDIVSNMKNILSGNERETLNRCYSLKIGQYSVNLASTDDVIILLQAALDKYQAEELYKPVLNLDPEREISVLTASVEKEENIDEDAFDLKSFCKAGIDEYFEVVFSEVEPAVEKDFDDYEQGIMSMGFGDDIEVVECYLPQSEIVSVEDAIEDIVRDKATPTIYEVVSGDTLSQIAEKVDIPMDDIIAMNDSLDNEYSLIRPGDELTITVPKPKLSVSRIEQLYYEEDYEAEIEYKYNDEWYTTDTKTLREPSAGHHNVMAQITYNNDDKENVVYLKEEVTYQSIAKLVEKGTKIPPTYIKPIAGGRLTSNFGHRKRPTKGASTYHKGVDWATPTGTAVVASSGGTVIRAGWGSGYGYCVFIQHPDGKVTRYGHLSKVLVSSGQSVSQGQKIALSGNTGVSTGPHLHFEILINGSQVNPLNYLN